ncbi:hypothetical protein P280DRAFT_516451 [Massarina eburnea CBS 473.64]|uniref:Uncharacterized protein n=1 Tax=Massarina eburnea CBS 473.64 TaxID=1395130 RepID=A0A6A6S669_9PLEO|nr:hypothetical protein P280DRAFT_516451 [Massarina eburnea CBS 473.64]
MRFPTHIAALIAVALTNTNASTTTQKRDIPNVGETTMRGNISSIAAWAYNAFAYAIVTASNSTSDLTYLCTTFNTTSTRLYTAFPETSGDIGTFARRTICDASTANPPAPLPIWYNTLWYLKSYLGGIFTVQGYYGKPFDKEIDNGPFYASMCWYLEASLMRGLWAPNRDTDESGVDVESSWCAASGYYSKGPYSTYTNESVSVDVAHQADVLVSRLVAYMLKLVLKEQEQVDYICTNYARFKPGIAGLGLVSSVFRGLVCGEGNKGIVEVQKAKLELLDAMTDLFILQLLEAGNYKGYYKYLCETTSADGYAKVGLDGKKVVEAACEAAKGETA